MKKVFHQKNYVLEYEGYHWTIELAVWVDDGGNGELRVYRIDGDINHPFLMEALELEASVRGLKLLLERKR